MLPLAILTILIGFGFAFTNGFQNAASTAATFIVSRSAEPRSGIVYVSGCETLGALLGGSAVAFTIFSLLRVPFDESLIVVVLSALIAAAAWNIVTWRYGLPPPSTYGLIGGLTGAAIAAAGVSAINWGVTELMSSPPELTGMVKIVVFLFLSLVIGFSAGYLLHRTTMVMLRPARRTATRGIVTVNWVTAGIMAFSIGANDGQKQMGVIALVLFAAGLAPEIFIPLWTRVACAVLIGAGTLSGGWRAIITLGRRIFPLQPIHSFNSQLSSSTAMIVSNLTGSPVSSTQIVTSSILGVGYAENPGKMRWSVGGQVVGTILITIPATLILSGALYLIITRLLGG